MYNNQTVQLVGRLSPKTRINLEQKSQHQLSNKMLVKHIAPDIFLGPMLDDIIPFSEILNQRKVLQSIQPIQYYEEPRPSRTILTTQPRSQTNKSSRSIKSNSSHKDQKSRMSNQKYELMSCCSCSCCGCSRKSSTRVKKTPTPKIKKPYQEIPSTNKSNKSNKSKLSVKQYSIASSDSKNLRKRNNKQQLNSSQSTKHKCEYHHYEQRQSHNTTHHKTRPSSVAIINPESERRKKLKEYEEKQKYLRNLYSAKQLQPQIRDNSQQKVPWRADIQKIEEGKLRKSRIEKIVQVQKDIVNKSLSRHRSASKKDQPKIVQPPDPAKVKMLEQRKVLMAKKDQKIIYDKKEAKRLKQVLEQLKKQKQQEKEQKMKKEKSLKDIEKTSKKILGECKKKKFEPTEQQIEVAFGNLQHVEQENQ